MNRLNSQDKGVFPSEFGGFLLFKRLGSGGSGHVFLAKRKEGGQLVALKLISPKSIHFPEAKEKLLSEVKAATKLNHPGICPVLESGEIEGIPFLVMTYIEGKSLAESIRLARADGKNALPWKKAVQWIEEVALSLHAAHEAGLIHRDIKPGNVMIAPSGRAVLLDFGTAGIEGGALGSKARFSGLLGTPDYIPPEIISGQADQYVRQADIYSLGVTLYECLCLKSPFSAPNMESLCQNILSGKYESLLSLRPDLPEDLSIVLALSMDREPGKRYGAARSFAYDLNKVRAGVPLGPF